MTESFKKFTEWIYHAMNHTVTDFDIWEAGRDYQKQKDVTLCLSLKYDSDEADFFARVLERQEE